jgi:hypothetical protein
LGEGDVVLNQAARVDVGLVLASSAAEDGEVNDAGNEFDLAADKPVGGGLELVKAVAFALELETVNLADRRPG